MTDDNRCRFCGGAGCVDDDPEGSGQLVDCRHCDGTGFRIKESASPELQRILAEALQAGKQT